MHIQDNGDSYQLHLPAAGLQIDDLLISVEGHVVKIGSRNEEQEASSDAPLQQIRADSLRKVSRAIRLPRDADPSSLVTSMAHGMLELNVGKSPSAPNERDSEEVNATNSSSRRDVSGLSKSALVVALALAVIAGLVCTAMVAGPAAVTKPVLIALKGLAFAPLVILELALITGCAFFRFFFFFSLFSMLFAPCSMPFTPWCMSPRRAFCRRASPRHCYRRNWCAVPQSMCYISRPLCY